MQNFQFEGRHCTRCGEEFPATAEFFARNKNRKDGLVQECKRCQSQRAKICRENNLGQVKERLKLRQEEKANLVTLDHLKQVRSCWESKPLSEFTRNPCTVDELRNIWKPCDAERSRRYAQEHRPKLLLRYKFKSLRLKYGLSEERWKSLLLAQNGVCACCFGPPSSSRGFVVDHDHETGKIRGLLCQFQDRKSTRLNSSHTVISYAVFCLKK